MNYSKKRIIINIHYLEIGGAETSLIGLLHTLDPKDLELDLLINDSRGELMQQIPDWVNIVKTPVPLFHDRTTVERDNKKKVILK